MQSILMTFVKAYRLLLSPSLGSACRFEPTCSAYSLRALELHGAAWGSYLTLARLARCHPWCEGGHDPVPAVAPRLLTRFVAPLGASPEPSPSSPSSQKKPS